MAHWSEDSRKLDIHVTPVRELAHLPAVEQQPRVTLLWFPFGRTWRTANASDAAFRTISDYCARLHPEDTVCVLTTPEDAALLLLHLQNALHYQLWAAVQTASAAYPQPAGELPRRHAAFLVLTRYKGALRHTKTRIGYTYCPACGKTTKDYGGKKHTYHEYGTLLSDVWRDVDCDPADIAPLTDRLADLFGLAPYSRLSVLDLRGCRELAPAKQSLILRETQTLFQADFPTEEAASDFAAPASQTLSDSRLLNADCLDALRALRADSVDFCFADPPYNLDKKYDRWDDALQAVEYFRWCDQWLSELYRVLKPGRTVCVLNIPLWAVRHFQHLCSLMQFQSWIVWEALGFPVRMIMPSHYALLCFSKGQPRILPGLAADNSEAGPYLRPLAPSYCLRAGCVAQRRRRGECDVSELNDLWSDIHRLKHNSRRVDHPCQLPPHLMRRLIALFTRPGETVLDCFNGAGTTTLVARQMQRAYIGIELSSDYHRIALERHRQIERGADPFAKNEDVPKAKNSRVERLPKQQYVVSKKVLQLDVRRIARQLGRLPTRAEVAQFSPHPIAFFDDYFTSWGEVCAAARTTGMSEQPTQTEPSRPQPAFRFEEM